MLDTIVYVSSATTAVDDMQIRAILKTACARNRDDDLTGVLYFVDGSFIQVLEGAPGKVDAAMERIRRDPRHHGIIELYRSRIEQRAFSQWRMGYPQADDADSFDVACPQMRNIVERGCDEIVRALIAHFFKVSRPYAA